MQRRVTGQKSHKGKRTGKPLTIYFAPTLAAKLVSVSERRRVSKSAVVRYAVERLLDQLSNGQLELPLGL
jgi:hypothetical protein